MNEEKVPDGIEERLKKQEAALEALKDVPTMLASLIGQGKIDKPEMKSTWSLGLSDEEDQQDFEKDADNLLGNVQSEDDDPHEKEVEELLNDIEMGSDLGPEVSQNVAASFIKTVTRPLSKESKSKLRENIKTRSNCKEFVPPKINNEIWRIIPSNARLADVKQQQIQQAFASGLSALAVITDQVLSRKSEIPKEVVSTVVRLAIDTGNIVGDQAQQLNSTRRFDLKKYLNPEYGGICSSQVEHSEWLFGKDLSENLKSSNATSNLIRNTAARGNRFHPYQRQNIRPNFTPLNFNRPFRHQRGNGQFRNFNARQNRNPFPAWKPNQFQRKD
ncbi:hypothetical protein Fcan01_08833 [Folsomia candida]|uniref:Uncharacterized protein n=1 Tax=Folsomia candida TaxID=158441 RepID=A0A226EGP6_FOLCA|nr:hypothetical protein Fcan01_08833 [Folsomia candida]